MNSIKGTKTEKNLLASFAGEGQARNRYTFWASKARKEGYEQIAAIFELTANQEKEHAERFFKFLEGGDVEAKGIWPAGVIASTLENLEQAARGEHEEGEVLYPKVAAIAEEEGFDLIARTFLSISVAERAHEKRYQELAENILGHRVFERESEETVWQCRNCGYIHIGRKAPEKCPSCDHAKAYFELKMHNW